MKFQTILILTSLFLVLVLIEPARGQQCGPGCPACSGKAVGDLLSPETILGSVLYIPEGEEETAVLKFRYGLVSWMDVGIGYALDTE